MKNKLALLIVIPLLLLSACGSGSEYPTGAMTDDASLTLTWGREELVLDGVTLATLVTTELFYATANENGAAEEDVSVVFDLLKYLAGEGWDLSACRTWVLTDRQGNAVFVPTEQVPDGLYVGITSGTENLDYPVSVIPDGPTAWKVWELARVDFSLESAQVLADAYAAAQAADRLQAARDQVEGTRHIALAQGLTGPDGILLGDLIRDNLASAPSGTVLALTAEGSRRELDAGQVLAAEYSGGQVVIDGLILLCLTYERQAIWLVGPISMVELFTAADMVEAEDYTCFSANGANIKLLPEQAQAAQIQENAAGRLQLVYGDQVLEDVVSVTAGQPIVEEEL